MRISRAHWRMFCVRLACGMTCLLAASIGYSQITIAELDAAWKQELQRGQELQRQAKYAQAESAFQQALKTSRKLGEDSLPVAACLNSLAILFHWQHKYVEAEPNYQQALSILEAKVGPDHSRVGVVRKNLGDLYREQGRLGEASDQFHRSFEIVKVQFASAEPSLLGPLRDLAELDFQIGRFQQAAETQREILSILEASTGATSPETVTGWNSLGVIYLTSGRPDAAESSFREALGRAEDAGDPDSLLLARGLRYLADVLRDRLQLAEAETMLTRSLAICDRQPSPNADMAMALNNLAHVYASQRVSPKAEDLFRESIDVWERIAGPNNPETATGRYNLASFYTEQERFDEAEPLFESALEALRDKLGPQDPRVSQVSDAYSAMLVADGRPEAAEAIRANLALGASPEASAH